MSIKVYTDGASRGNPGKAALGAVAYDEDGKTLFELSEYLGLKTNNYAEYKAAIEAFRKLKDLGKSKESIELLADSKLLIEQIKGNWKVKHPNIKPLFAELKALVSGFKEVSFRHIARDENQVADALANQALDKRS